MKKSLTKNKNWKNKIIKNKQSRYRVDLSNIVKLIAILFYDALYANWCGTTNHTGNLPQQQGETCLKMKNERAKAQAKNHQHLEVRNWKKNKQLVGVFWPTKNDSQIVSNLFWTFFYINAQSLRGNLCQKRIEKRIFI